MSWKPTVRELLAEAFDAFFNLDSRVFRTLRDIWIPGYLTKAYFAGKHKRYLHPLRLFLVAALVHFAAFGFFVSRSAKNQLADIRLKMAEASHQMDLLSKMDSVAIALEQEYPGQPFKAPLDSIAQRFDLGMELDLENDGDMSIEVDSSGFRMNTPLWGSNIPLSDLMTRSAEDLYKKYEVEGFWSRILVQQQVRFFQDNQGFIQFIIGNLIWMVFLLVPFLAGVLFLFYWRKRWYFIEHLIFSYHLHATAFLVVTPLFLAEHLLTEPVIGWTLLILMIFLWFAFKAYYQQAWWVTLLKFLLFGFFYLVFLGVFSGATVVAAFFLF